MVLKIGADWLIRQPAGQGSGPIRSIRPKSGQLELDRLTKPSGSTFFFFFPTIVVPRWQDPHNPARNPPPPTLENTTPLPSLEPLRWKNFPFLTTGTHFPHLHPRARNPSTPRWNPPCRKSFHFLPAGTSDPTPHTIPRNPPSLPSTPCYWKTFPSPNDPLEKVKNCSSFLPKKILIIFFYLISL